jgi:hypothetical protein
MLHIRFLTVFFFFSRTDSLQEKLGAILPIELPSQFSEFYWKQEQSSSETIASLKLTIVSAVGTTSSDISLRKFRVAITSALLAADASRQRRSGTRQRRSFVRVLQEGSLLRGIGD